MSVLEQNQSAAHDDDQFVEIRLIDITAFLKRSRRAIVIGSMFGLLIGALYAFSRQNEYTSSVTLLPESQTRGGALGNLGPLAGLAGIDVSSLNSVNDIVRPELYPTVLQSVPFALSLSKQPVYSIKFRRTEPLESFINATNEPGWLSKLLAGKVDSSIASPQYKTEALSLTKQQDELTKFLIGRVLSTYDKKSGVLTISSTMQDPVVAATTTEHALKYLTDYIVSYRTEKARQEVEFLSHQTATAKQRYHQAEYKLSEYRDQNRSIYQNTAKIEEQRIQAEFMLAQELYNTLSKQAEMAKIKVQQDTPVFKILEPAQVPLKKSGPKRTVILLISALLGGVAGLTFKAVSLFRNHQASTV